MKKDFSWLGALRANRYQALPLLFYFSSRRGTSLGTRLGVLFTEIQGSDCMLRLCGTTHTHVYAHKRTHARNSRTHATQMEMWFVDYSYMYTHVHARTHAHTCNSRVHAYMRLTNARIHARTQRIHSPTRCTHTHTHTNTCTHTHVHTHTQTHKTHTHIHIYTYIHTHTTRSVL